MEAVKDNLTGKQVKAIMHLLVSPNMKDAAKAAGVGETTLWRWMQVENFQDALRQARNDALAQTTARLQQATTTAVDTLEDVMKNQRASAMARVSAAKATLEIAYKAYEMEEIKRRLEDLEQHVKENGA